MTRADTLRPVPGGENDDLCINVKTCKKMDKNILREAMYALPGSVVVKRRKPLLMPAVLFLAGAAMIVSNNLYGAELTNNLRSSLVFTGGALAVAGLIFVVARMFGSDGLPFHNGLRCYLLYDELYFERGMRDEVLESVAQGDLERLLRIRRADVPALTVSLYRAPDNRFAALQAYEYAELEYRPLCAPNMVGEGVI